jgi:YjbE family integral membrane protein
MDLGTLGNISFDWAFLMGLLNIIIINLILSGDNAVCIALAVRSLPKDQRRKGILLGSAAAVVLRVVLTFFVAQLLQVHLVKLAGGVLITWIAVKLFVEGAPDENAAKQAGTVGQAVRIILVADMTMALDNMLAVAGASNGNLFLLLFGLGSSIPFVVLASNVLSMLMEKYKIIIYIGAAILGKVAGEMIFTDPFVVKYLGHSETLLYAVEGLFAVGVIAAGKLWLHLMIRREKQGHPYLQEMALQRASSK